MKPSGVYFYVYKWGVNGQLLKLEVKVLNYFCRQCFDKNPGQFNMKGKSELDNGRGKKAVTAGADYL